MIPAVRIGDAFAHVAIIGLQMHQRMPDPDTGVGFGYLPRDHDPAISRLTKGPVARA